MNWKISSFSEVKKLGRENPVEANLPAPSDVAVIMYTSGSTGQPKVLSLSLFLLLTFLLEFFIFLCWILSNFRE